MAFNENDRYGSDGIGEIRMSPEPKTTQTTTTSETNILAKIAHSEHPHPMQRVAKALDAANGSLPIRDATKKTGMDEAQLLELSRLFKGVLKLDRGAFYSPLYEREKPSSQQKRIRS